MLPGLSVSVKWKSNDVRLRAAVRIWDSKCCRCDRSSPHGATLHRSGDARLLPACTSPGDRSTPVSTDGRRSQRFWRSRCL